MTTDLQAPDLVLVGGTVHRFDGAPPATALAASAGRIVAVGTDDEVLDMVAPTTRVIDLAGRVVIPGINDSHLHATWLGQMWPGTLMGGMPGGAPLFAEEPRDVGIDGLGSEVAPEGAPSMVPPLRTAGERRAAILRAAGLALSMGITSWTEPGLGAGENDGPTGVFGDSTIDQYRALAAAGELPIRVTVLSLFGLVDGPSTWEAFESGLASLDHSTPDASFLDFAGVKIFADGIPPMHAAYTDRVYTSGARPDLLVAGADPADRERNLRRMVVAGHRAGLQVAVHATGDRAIEVFLDAVEAAQAERDDDLGHYVIHGDMVRPDQLARMASLGVGYNTQAGIATRTAPMVDAALGAGAAQAFWPLGAALEAGVSLRLSSDAPVLSPDWRVQVAAADAWMGPAVDWRARMAALLAAYTVAAAEQDGASEWKGTITPGKVADLTVLDADPFELAPAELPGVAVEMTIVDGRIAFDRADADRASADRAAAPVLR